MFSVLKLLCRAGVSNLLKEREKGSELRKTA